MRVWCVVCVCVCMVMAQSDAETEAATSRQSGRAGEEEVCGHAGGGGRRSGQQAGGPAGGNNSCSGQCQRRAHQLTSSAGHCKAPSPVTSRHQLPPAHAPLNRPGKVAGEALASRCSRRCQLRCEIARCDLVYASFFSFVVVVHRLVLSGIVPSPAHCTRSDQPSQTGQAPWLCNGCSVVKLALPFAGHWNE